MPHVIPEMDPILQELRRRIRATGLRYADIEERAGFSRKYLSQLLNGYVDIKIYQLLKILMAIEVEFSEFFTAVARGYRRRVKPASEQQVEQVVERLIPQLPEYIAKIIAGLEEESDPSASNGC